MSNTEIDPGLERLEPRTLLSSASFVGVDATTQGNWKGLVGLQGEYVFGSANELPQWATLAPPAKINVLDADTTDPRAPLKWGINTDRISADLAGQTIPLNLNITDGKEHQVSLYVLDWDSKGLAETIDVLDANSGTVLSTKTVQNFIGGQYVSFNVTGDVTFRVTSTTAQNAVVNGIFLDPVGGAPGNPFSGDPNNPSTAVPFSVSTDTTILKSRAAAQARGPINMLLVGDSITDFWQTNGASQYSAAFSKYNPLDIGVSATTTQGCLAELNSGIIDGLAPKVAMVLIGSNDLKFDLTATDAQIAAGVLKVVKTLEEKLPDTKILLLGLFPRQEYASSPYRPRITDINNMVQSAVKDDSNVAFRDIGGLLLDSDGTISTTLILSDYTHPTSAGYQVWANAVGPAIAELVAEEQVKLSAALTRARTITAASHKAYTFTVTYSDPLGINASTVGRGDFTVTSAGYSQIATLVSTGLVNGSTVVATYSVPAPAAGWSHSRNGIYTIALRANQVADISGNFALPTANLGHFTVHIHASLETPSAERPKAKAQQAN